MKNLTTILLFGAAILFFQTTAFAQNPNVKAEKVNKGQLKKNAKMQAEPVIDGAEDGASSVGKEAKAKGKSLKDRLGKGGRDKSKAANDKAEGGKAKAMEAKNAASAQKPDKEARELSKEADKLARKDRVKSDDDEDEDYDDDGGDGGPKKDKVKGPKSDKGAQGRAKGKEMQNDRAADREDYDKSENADRNNARGDKGGVNSRKAFGQEQALQAKLRKESRKKELDETISKNQSKAESARQKVEAAKAKLELDKQRGNINEAAYKDKKAKIEAAEAAINKLEQDLESGQLIKSKVD